MNTTVYVRHDDFIGRHPFTWPRPLPTEILGTQGNDVLTGNSLNNRIFGLGGNDRLIGSFGSDLLDGGAGWDTADYSHLAASITLRSQGIIQKAGIGTDTIAGIERIVGNAHYANLIDGFVAGPQSTSFVVDLGRNALDVNGIPGIGSAHFTVENFRDVRGTANADRITGSAAGNTFFGSAGNDVYDGGRGWDTIDYSGLGAAVTLRSQGLIAKAGGGLGTDVIANMERIVGAAGFHNEIDGRVAGPQSTSFQVDLGAGSLVINGIPGLGSAHFSIANFENVHGTANADHIVGSAVGNALSGGAGADGIYGQGGNDMLIGGAGNDHLDGGWGYDTAGFSGFRHDYVVTRMGHETYAVQDLRAGSPDGADILVNIEGVDFADGHFVLATLVPPPPPPPPPVWPLDPWRPGPIGIYPEILYIM